MCYHDIVREYIRQCVVIDLFGNYQMVLRKMEYNLGSKWTPLIFLPISSKIQTSNDGTFLLEHVLG